MNNKLPAVTNETPEIPLSDFFVGREVVNKRTRKFKENKYKILSEEMKKNGFFQGESICVWYSKEYILSLVNEMEMYGANGVRAYFGEYDGKPGDNPPAGQLGLLFVLTEEHTDGKTRDIILETKTNFEGRKLAAKIPSDQGEAREYNIFDPSPPSRFNHECTFPEETLPVDEN